ncbi:hypothetical protein [Mycobacterium sp. 1245852.3]|uniref:hypothetical protein n=1 Tax=Mycobacterium sp. 1245852.3 TaxID=1856860 RepID=UPI00080187DA|nr:hypothetical protein [Mycobacterium sp. 1245852.3]OBJ90559.1 hypothetical protein A9W96_22875 [Mycobacterium sp. 1245852.3]
MAEGHSLAPSGREEASAGVSPEASPTDDQSQAEAQPQQSNARREDTDTSIPRRSNEFWLAIAGIFATVIVGVVGSTLAYRTSGNQIRAETSRTTAQFNKERRISAYTDFLTAYSDLEEAEFEFAHQLAPNTFTSDSVVDKSANFRAKSDTCRKAVSRVVIVGSNAVTTAMTKIINGHNDIQNKIQPLALAIMKSDNPQKYVSQVADLQYAIDREQHDEDGLRMEFVKAAKADLGLAS